MLSLPCKTGPMPIRGKRLVDISILETFRGQLSRPKLRRIITHTLDRILPDEACQLSVAIADDDTVRRLNRDYRGLDEVTDVLSFSTFHQGHWEGEGEAPPVGSDVPFVLPPLEPRHLGEVIISYPQAMRQAGPGPLAVEKELGLLIIHGVLHLLGFDHVKAPEESDMKAKEREILATIYEASGT